jgi:hypothetical protein
MPGLSATINPYKTAIVSRTAYPYYYEYYLLLIVLQLSILSAVHPSPGKWVLKVEERFIRSLLFSSSVPVITDKNVAEDSENYRIPTDCRESPLPWIQTTLNNLWKHG